MTSFENPKRINLLNESKKREAEEMVTQRPEVDEKKWREAVDRAINFVRNHVLALSFWDEGFDEDKLSENERRELRELEKILGKNMIEYLSRNEFGSLSGALPQKTIEKEEAGRRKEYERIRGLTREELIQEAEKYTREMAEEDE